MPMHAWTGVLFIVRHNIRKLPHVIVTTCIETRLSSKASAIIIIFNEHPCNNISLETTMILLDMKFTRHRCCTISGRMVYKLIVGDHKIMHNILFQVHVSISILNLKKGIQV